MSKICLSYDCPKVKEFITPENGAFDCSLCQKKVHDFTHMDEQEFSMAIPLIQKENLCGVYRLDQIEDSKNLRFTTKLHLKYIKAKQRNRMSLAFIMSCLFLIIGCRSSHRTSGAPMMDKKTLIKHPTDVTQKMKSR